MSSQVPHSAVADWLPAFPEADVLPGRPRLLKRDGRQIAVFRTDEGLHALDNLCPHEGYPLLQGEVRDCVLTCAWHNFKFDVRDGRSLLGEESVRAYPVRVREGRVEIDVAEPDPAAAIPERLASLEQGLHERTLDRVGRDVARLLALGVPAHDVAFAAASFDARHGRFVAGHGVAVACDLLPVLDRSSPEEQVLPLLQLMDLVSEDNAHRTPREMAAAIDPGTDLDAAGERLRDAVENERYAESFGLVRGALERDLGRNVIEPWLFALCASHFVAFGHHLIYSLKVFDLLERVGFERAGEVIPGVFAAIQLPVHHDRLPTWKGLRLALDSAATELAEWSAAQGRTDATLDVETFALTVLDGKKDAATGAVADALRAGAPVGQICDGLSLAAAERLLRFDASHETDPSVQEGWLDVTHLQTFARAAREVQTRWRDPRALCFLLQAAAFIRQARPLDVEGCSGLRVPSAGSASLAQVIEALEAKQPEATVACAAAWLGAGGDVGALHHAADEVLLRDDTVAPIVTAHHLKNLRAGRQECEALGDDPRAPLPMLAALRFLATPVPPRRRLQDAHEAVDFVVHGRKPNALTG